MFRDSRGVVHTVSSADPLLDLPGDTAAALADALLRPGEDGPPALRAASLDAALERCEGVRELLERWQDAFFAALPETWDPEEEARWAAEAGLSLAELEERYAQEEREEQALTELVLSGGDDQDELAALDDLEDPVGTVDLTDGALQALQLDEDEDDALLALVPEELVTRLERELLLLPLRVRLEALVAAAALVGTWSDLLGDHEKLLGHLVLAHGEQTAAQPHPDLADRHARLHADGGPGHPG